MKLQTCLLILLFIVLYIIIYFLLKHYCTNKVEVFSFQSINFKASKHPTILFIGSQHGNEPAGAEALNQLIKMFTTNQIQLQNAKLVIVPCPNPCGKMLHIRFQPHQLLLFKGIDLNRNYPEEADGEGRCEVSNQLLQLIKESSFVIDMHEGWGFRKLQPQSLGSGVYPTKHPIATSIAVKATNQLNNLIDDKNKQFVCEHLEEVKGSLREYCNIKNIPCILIETTGQNNIQPLDTRANQHLQLALNILRQLNVVV